LYFKIYNLKYLYKYWRGNERGERERREKAVGRREREKEREYGVFKKEIRNKNRRGRVEIKGNKIGNKERVIFGMGEYVFI